MENFTSDSSLLIDFEKVIIKKHAADILPVCVGGLSIMKCVLYL